MCPIDRQKELLRLVQSISPSHSRWQVFEDFCEMGAIAISNAVDLTKREAREERYMSIVGRYSPEDANTFAKMLGVLVLALEDGHSDVLGKFFHGLELHNKWLGQFFTPYEVCRMLAKMTLGNPEDLQRMIAERGFITAMEPACGAGATVIAIAHELKDAGINYQQNLHVTAVDIDSKCVHMAYLQFALLHIPATVVHGNSLTLEEHDHWYTPAHIMNGWSWKLKRDPQPQRAVEIRLPEPNHAGAIQLGLFGETAV